jgi:SAM-dependent methyltransferase
MSETVWYARHPILKSIYTAQKSLRRGLRDRLEVAYYRYNLARSHSEVKKKVAVADARYDAYLREQLEETLRKKRLKGEVHFEVIPLIDMLNSKFSVAGKDALCVGCRNTDEIRYFKKLGAGRVVGIDLFSDHEDIVVMDMHDLKFPDGSFDIVYSRHSFEHAYDKRKAGMEFVRVLRNGGVIVIEVPGKYKGGADYNLFEGLDDVLNAFTPHIGEFIWKEYSRKEENTDKMDIIRVMFHVTK